MKAYRARNINDYQKCISQNKNEQKRARNENAKGICDIANVKLSELDASF